MREISSVENILILFLITHNYKGIKVATREALLGLILCWKATFFKIQILKDKI